MTIYVSRSGGSIEEEKRPDFATGQRDQIWILDRSITVISSGEWIGGLKPPDNTYDCSRAENWPILMIWYLVVTLKGDSSVVHLEL